MVCRARHAQGAQGARQQRKHGTACDQSRCDAVSLDDTLRRRDARQHREPQLGLSPLRASETRRGLSRATFLAKRRRQVHVDANQHRREHCVHREPAVARETVARAGLAAERAGVGRRAGACRFQVRLPEFRLQGRNGEPRADAAPFPKLAEQYVPGYKKKKEADDDDSDEDDDMIEEKGDYVY